MSNIQPTQTFVYKTVPSPINLDIHLDVYLPPNAKGVPVMVWFHGGGLLQGNRNQLPPHLRRAVGDHNIAVLSADYRFAPQAQLPDIFSDVKDCINFVRSKLASQLPDHQGAIDPSRLAVSGSSAGGYLALLAGLYCDPKPTCLLPIYPITDPLGHFFTTPQPPPMQRKLASREELAECLDPSTPVVANCGPLPQDVRMHMYVRMMADASLPSLLGLSPPTSNRADAQTPWRISRNVYTHALPPTYIIHGDGDEAVGVEQADEVVGAALGCGVEVEYERVHGANHFLDVGKEWGNEGMYSWVMEKLRR